MRLRKFSTTKIFNNENFPIYGNIAYPGVCGGALASKPCLDSGSFFDTAPIMVQIILHTSNAVTNIPVHMDY